MANGKIVYTPPFWKEMSTGDMSSDAEYFKKSYFAIKYTRWYLKSEVVLTFDQTENTGNLKIMHKILFT